MQKTIAIIGAGPGLGLSIAKKFGKQQFNVALIARNSEKLAVMVDELKTMNIQANSYLADITDLSQLQTALRAAKKDFGGIDVLEFSPYSGPDKFRNVLEVTPENLMEQVNSYLLPAIHSINEVLPNLQEKGEGAILFTTGLSAFHPIPQLGNAGIVMSGIRNYATNLHNVLKEQGIYVGHLSIGTFIAAGTEGDPDLIAEAWYDLYSKKEQFEATFPKEIKLPF
ncbi:SDR family NAD(P)-dependent oxidoreductase [Priestia megaterium]|uniref:SDR family NAD(P)-dependent oxidoreductase n=1 Tax=Priestia megaterium TaxID=1404 RepID=UPI003000D9EA